MVPNWQEIARQVSITESLSEDRLQRELTELAHIEPEIAHELTSYYTRNGKLGSFETTSVTEIHPSRRILKPGTTLGVWQIGEVLGSGGMGDVYKAKRNDGLYEQIVAIKVIKGRDADSQQLFELERKRLASLEHPGISRIIDGGVTHDDRSYMVMEYVEGVPIDEYIAQNQLSRAKSLDLFCDLCAAVTHAHAKLILHRDIKTSNVLVDTTGAVRLIDFGISSNVGEGSDDFDGPLTIAYAPPELLLMQRPVVGSDVYSLGVLLHHILTGKTPQRQPDCSLLIDQEAIANEELSAVVQKATAFKPNDRYSSAALFARDVEAYQNLMPVLASNGGSLYKSAKFLRRNILASALATAFVVALSGGLVGSLILANTAKREAARANLEADRANAELARADWNLKRAGTLSEISAARADSFQYVFGVDDNKADLSAKFLNYIAGIKSQEKENYPTADAAKRFVVGKHFLDRNDYQTAKEVLEPWVTAGYGNPEILAYGQASLGFVLSVSGDQERAAELFRKAENYYLSTPLKNTIEHAVAALQVALNSDDKQATDRAVDIINIVLEEDTEPYNRSYLFGQMHKIQLKQGDFASAYAALKQQIALMQGGGFGGNSSFDASYINFARMNILFRNDIALARENLNTALEIADTRKGESYSLGHVYMFEALLSWIEKDYAAGLTKNAAGLKILKKYAGKSAGYASALGIRAVICLDMEQSDAATEATSELEGLSRKVTGSWPELLKLYSTARIRGLESAQQIYEGSSFPRDSIKRDLMTGYFLRHLAVDGLQL